jgi:hypothetical protein
MAITKRLEYIVGVLSDKTLEVRTDTVIEEDGVIISRAIHRHCVTPGEDLSGQHAEVQEIGNAVHTDAVIAAYRAKIAALIAE